MSGMADGQVPTPGSMLVFVILVFLAATHMNPPMMVRETINLSIHKADSTLKCNFCK